MFNSTSTGILPAEVKSYRTDRCNERAMMHVLNSNNNLKREVPMESSRTRTNVPKPTEGGIGVVSRNGTRCYTQSIHPLTQSGFSVLPSQEVPSVTNAITMYRFCHPLNVQLVRQWCCELTPKLFSFVGRVVDLHRVALKEFLFGFESSVAKPANSLPYLNNDSMR
jgi:hypothetical protein